MNLIQLRYFQAVCCLRKFDPGGAAAPYFPAFPVERHPDP